MASKINYFWNFLVFIIFVYYFYQLNKKSKKLTHTSSIEKFTENPSILICVSLNKNCKNKITSRSDFKKSKYKNETMKNLICYINQNVSKNPKLIIEEAKRWNFFDAFENKINNSVKNEIIMFDYRLCANYDLTLNLKHQFYSFKFNFNSINTKIFLYPADYLNLFDGQHLIKFDFKNDAKKISSLIIKQIKIHNSIYKRSCNNMYKLKQINNCFKIYCYQQCFKNKINSYKFLYTQIDNLLIEMSDETKNPLDVNCLKKCSENFHGVYYYLTEMKFKEKNHTEVEFVFDSYSQEIIPMNLITAELFFFEVSSLLNVFIGFSYVDFLFKCLLECKKYFRISLNSLAEKLEIFIFIFVTFNLLNCFSKVVCDYKMNFFVNTSTSIFPIENIPFSLSVCFDVKTIMEKIKKESLVDLNEQIEKNNIFSFESYTLSFKKLLNKSQIRFLSKYRNYNINNNEVKTFYLSGWTFVNTKLKIYKCYFFNINVKLDLIENLIEVSQLELDFNKPASFYYLTNKGFYPNSKTHKLYENTLYKIFQTVLKGDSMAFKCENYKGKCFSRQECIDKCYVSKYIDKFSKLPSNIPILLKWYKKKWYNLLSFHLHNTNQTKDLKSFKNNCSRYYALSNCNQKIYKPISKPIVKTIKKIKVFLHYTTRTDSKVLLLNKLDFMNIIVTSVNIWLGLNIPIVIKNFLLNFSKKILTTLNIPFSQSQTYKKTFNFFFTFSLIICLIYNLLSHINATVKQSKITSVKYKFSSELEYPYILICLDYSNKINLSKKIIFNGYYLDNSTFSANDIFESITFLDYNLKIKKQTKFDELMLKNNSQVLKLSHFYFMNIKCYKLKYNLKMPFYIFHQKKNSFIFLTINLKPNITKYYLTLSTKRSFNFNHYKKMKNQKNIIYFYKSTVIYQDLYAFLKDIFNLFRREKTVNFNEGVSYSNFIKKKFKEEKNFSTLLLPLDEEYFNLTINDEEYLKFYKTKMVKLEKLNVDNNYVREFFTKVYSHYENKNQNQLVFKPMLLTYKATIEDKIPIENFFLVSLNIISFWFNFSLINFFYQFSSFSKKFFELFLVFNLILLNKLKRLFSKYFWTSFEDFC